MKVSLTEVQLRSFNNRLIYEGILDDMVFKISLIVEDGKTEPDMEWDFTNVKKDIDRCCASRGNTYSGNQRRIY